MHQQEQVSFGGVQHKIGPNIKILTAYNFETCSIASDFIKIPTE